MIQSSKFTILLALALFFSFCDTPQSSTETATEVEAPASPTTKKAEYAIVIHGGAGTILKKNMTDEKEAAYNEALNAALDIGEKVLQEGGTSGDAVVQTIMYLENSPLFNAGKGAVFNNAGKNEMDASYMDGATRNAGAVGGVTIVKNPILAARAVMEKSEHVMLTGAGAEQFAKEQGIETVDPQYFFTQDRWDALQKAKASEDQSTGMKLEDNDFKYGTVGCVALDKYGNITAGTSTGGMTNKRYNRIGDSPIIGAGTYANNETCGVSCTGHGEFFIRYAVAYDVSAMMEYLGLTVDVAAKAVVNKKLVDVGGSGGLIALDHLGNVSMPFNTEGMYRGYAKPGERVVKIYKD
ncbi:MAG: isoaspartyl peptidase/L-asparaginase [Saprospiraceae bacterium]|nr:MAG: isoaspartyl peptidase/L-asparaginase [Saprospiraceae bacterium]